MSAARLPYYQQDQEDQQRRGGGNGNGGRSSHQQHRGSYRRDRERERSRSRSRSESPERREQQQHRRRRSRSRSWERQQRRRRQHQQQQQKTQRRPHHSKDRDSREREHDRDSGRRSSYHRRSSDSPERRHHSHHHHQASSSSTSSSSSSLQQSASRSSSGRDNHKQQQQHSSKINAMSAVGAYYNLDIDEPFDKERIHREMEQKLREALAREGKVYPPPKPEPPSHPVFANDGSFMELFKKMQEQQQQQPTKSQTEMADNSLERLPALGINAAGSCTSTSSISSLPSPSLAVAGLDGARAPSALPNGSLLPAIAVGAATSAAAPYIAATAAGKSAPPPPMVGRRRGGKILKTGVVAKLKTPNDRDVDPKDFWSLYLAEVNKYKSNACDTDNGKRPLVK